MVWLDQQQSAAVNQQSNKMGSSTHKMAHTNSNEIHFIYKQLDFENFRGNFQSHLKFRKKLRKNCFFDKKIYILEKKRFFEKNGLKFRSVDFFVVYYKNNVKGIIMPVQWLIYHQRPQRPSLFSCLFCFSCLVEGLVACPLQLVYHNHQPQL